MAKDETITLTDKLDKDWKKIQNLVSQMVIFVTEIFFFLEVRVRNYFFSAGANWRPKFFFSRQMEKCGRQKVSVKLFLCSETQAKIIGRHGLAGKIFAIDVNRNQNSAEIIF